MPFFHGLRTTLLCVVFVLASNSHASIRPPGCCSITSKITEPSSPTGFGFLFPYDTFGNIGITLTKVQRVDNVANAAACSKIIPTAVATAFAPLRCAETTMCGSCQPGEIVLWGGDGFADSRVCWNTSGPGIAFRNAFLTVLDRGYRSLLAQIERAHVASAVSGAFVFRSVSVDTHAIPGECRIVLQNEIPLTLSLITPTLNSNIVSWLKQESTEKYCAACDKWWTSESSLDAQRNTPPFVVVNKDTCDICASTTIRKVTPRRTTNTSLGENTKRFPLINIAFATLLALLLVALSFALFMMFYAGYTW